MKHIKNWDKATVADIEADNLLLDATKIHVLSYQMVGKGVLSINKRDQDSRIKKFFQYHIDNEVPIVMHNGISYDVPLVEKLLGMDLSKLMLIDTLALSWYLNPDRKSHGLDSFFPDYGIEKPKVDDWQGLSYEEYQHRCEEDVKINKALWEDLKERLHSLYSKSKVMIDHGLVGGKRMTEDEEIYLDRLVGISEEEHVNRILSFLMFKMDCARLQEKTRIEADIPYLEATKQELEAKIGAAREELESVMPKVPKYANRKKPAKPYKKNGELSKSGENWKDIQEILKGDNKDEQGNPIVKVVDENNVKVIVGYDEPNVNSSSQVKDFLFLHGWEPKSFKFDKDEEAIQRWLDMKPGKGATQMMWKKWKEKKPEDRKIPQVSVQGDDGKELCESVLELEDDIPEIMAYSKYTTIKHRLDFVKGMLSSLEEGKWLVASIRGFTNTLRVKHRAPLTNLPGVDKPYGENIRGAMIAGKGKTLMGSDLSSLEDRVKHHFMLPHDPDYVETMMQDDFDPHILMALSAGLITEKEFEDFKKGIAPDHVKAARKAGKATNYASVYNAGPATIARSAGLPVGKGEQLYEGYWKLNWAVKAIAEEQVVIEVDGQKWLINPVNGLCYSLRKESDRFSTLAQGTGSFIFDMWVDNIQEKFLEDFNVKSLSGSWHDEVVVRHKDSPKAREKVAKIIYDSIEKVNKTYNLRRSMGCDVQFGDRYSEIH